MCNVFGGEKKRLQPGPAGAWDLGARPVLNNRN
jgi:hypothetical protein